jgi:ribosomal protein S18 acetylase RimI-like enzyme
MLVAVRDGAPVGFLAGLAAEDEGARAHVIDLIAVEDAARGSGAGGALVSRFVAGSEGSFDLVLVGTQEENPDATRFYERLGFERMRSAYDLHLHAGEPGSGG